MKLRPYQDDATKLAVENLRLHGGYGLFMEQRTGKTPTSRVILDIFQPQRLLVVCPLIAVEGVWGVHLAGLRAEVRIITWDSLWNQRKRLKKWAPDFIIADELHRAKNRRSKQSKALRAISNPSAVHPGAKYRLGLGGTPIEKGPEDAWAQYDFIDPKLFGSWDDFAERYLKYGGFMGKKVVGYKNLDEFQEKFQSRFYRALLEEVKEVPTDIAPAHLVEFDLVESREMYDSMFEKFLVEMRDKWIRVRQVSADGSVKFVRRRKRIVAPRVITQAMKLHQLSGGFIFDEDRVIHRFGYEKLLYAGALVEALGKVPVVIVVRFEPELYRLAQLLQALDRTVTLISGAHKEYKSGDPFDVAVVQIRSGISIDLSHAEELIFYSWGHSLLDYDQAKFRIRSYHATRARYHYLIARNTVDEELFSCVTQKVGFAKFLIDKYRRR